MNARIRAAFTLVELLVVITIIGMLIALLLPAIGSSTGVARATMCRNNLKQLTLAAITYETSKGHFPGYVQHVIRSNRRPATCGFDAATSTVFVRNCPIDEVPQEFSWATMLLPHLERQDLWDLIVDANSQPPIQGMDVLVCPSDSNALTVVGKPALSYVANTGAWDFDRFELQGKFLVGDGIGDTRDNGVFANLAHQSSRKSTRPGLIRDGAATTILLSENIHRSYDWPIAGKPPWFTWAAGDFFGMTFHGYAEQQFGMVWVVDESPQPGGSSPQLTDQERINGNEFSASSFPAFFPNFARPASEHPGGMNITFCDGHIQFVRDSIDYTVYQRLMTTNDRKCVDPVDHDNGVNPPNSAHPIHVFRVAPPLAESDYQ